MGKREKKEKKDILENMYVRRKSKAWYKLVKWGLIPSDGGLAGPDYSIFMLSVRGQLQLIRALELQEKRIRKLEVIAEIKMGG